MNNIESLKAKVYQGAKVKNLVITDEVLDRWAKEFEAFDSLGYIENVMIHSLIADICNRNNWYRIPGFSNEMCSLVLYCLDITRINPIQERFVFETFSNVYFQPKRINCLLGEVQRQLLIETLKSELPEYNFSHWAFHPIPKASNIYEKISIKGVEYCVQNTTLVITHKDIKLSLPKYQKDGKDYFYEEIREASYLAFDKYRYNILESDEVGKFESIIQHLDDEFKPYNLPLDDSLMYHYLIKKENREGIPSLNFGPYEELLSYVKPNNLYDLSAAIACQLTKNTQHINRYIRCRRTYSYPQYESDPRVDDLLDETYGALLYADTFVHIAHEIAGIDLQDCVTFYYHLRTNRHNLVPVKFYQEFENGCRLHSTLNEQDYNKLVNLIQENVGHLFWRCYPLRVAMEVYWGAYYKFHFPELFEACFLNGELTDDLQ